MCVCVCVLVAQSCLILCNLMDYSPPSSSIHEFSRQEYWSGLPFPSPYIHMHIYKYFFFLIIIYIYTQLSIYIFLCRYIGGTVVTNQPINAWDTETWVWSLGLEDLLQQEMATHSSNFTWKIPWRSLEGYSPWSHKVSNVTESHTHMHTHTHTHIYIWIYEMDKFKILLNGEKNMHLLKNLLELNQDFY